MLPKEEGPQPLGRPGALLEEELPVPQVQEKDMRLLLCHAVGVNSARSPFSWSPLLLLPAS